MNMKQSRKALICAIEGELDGRHCTEEQAAAILDHALPSLTEALARVEAERDDIAKSRDQAIADWNQAVDQRDAAQAQLAEALGEIRIYQQKFRYIAEGGSFYLSTAAECVRLTKSFLARYAQIEQQEALGAQAVDERDDQKSSDGWIEWGGNGTHAPFDEMLGADIRFRDGDEFSPSAVIGLRWSHSGNGRDIIAYRLHERAALATQPAAGEPVATLMLKRSLGSCSVGVVRFDASRLPEGALVDVYLAPPAAGGEPEQQTAIKADDLPTKKYPLGAFDFDAPVAAGEPVAWAMWSDGRIAGVTHHLNVAKAWMESHDVQALGVLAPAAAHESNPAGYVLVPVEPTIAQLAALGFNGDEDAALGHGRACVELTERYKSMLKVSPASTHGAGLHFSTTEDLASAIRQVSAYEDLGPELIAEEMFKQAGASSAHGDEAVQYRLLRVGEIIQATDELLRDDCTTWQPMSDGPQLGIGWGWHAGLMPMRRVDAAIRAQAGEGGEV